MYHPNKKHSVIEHMLIRYFSRKIDRGGGGVQYRSQANECKRDIVTCEQNGPSTCTLVLTLVHRWWGPIITPERQKAVRVLE